MTPRAFGLLDAVLLLVCVVLILWLGHQLNAVAGLMVGGGF